MAKLEILNKTAHANLRINNSFSEGLGYNTGLISILPNEVAAIQREFPIVLRKNPETDDYILNAMLGFEANENLFLSASGEWTGAYVPLAFAKGPFLMGPGANEKGEEQYIYYVDEDDPRVGQEIGERIFTEAGELSSYMESVRQGLKALQFGAGLAKDMIDAFLAADLIEPVALDVTFADGEAVRLDGAYTIAAEKLRALSGDQLAALNDKGYLSLAFYISDSLNNILKLIDIKQGK